MSFHDTLSLLPNTVVRGEWDAEMPRNVWATPSVDYPVGHVLVTNSGFAPCDNRDDCVTAIRELQARHMHQDMLPDIKQNFLVGGDGNCYLGRGWLSDPWLPEDYMDKLHHILHVSYFGPPGRQPTEDETKVLMDLIELGIKRGLRMFDSTDCRLNLVSRGDWGAHPAEDSIPLLTPVSHVLHTFTGTKTCFDTGECIEIVKKIQSQDMANKLGDIKYNFLIGGEGSVFIGRGWEVMPPLNPKNKQYWETSIEIAHIGPAGFPSDTVVDSVNKLLKRGIQGGYLIKKFAYVVKFDKQEGPESSEEIKNTTKEREIIYE